MFNRNSKAIHCRDKKNLQTLLEKKFHTEHIFRTNNQLYNISALLRPPIANCSFWVGSKKHKVKFDSILLCRLFPARWYSLDACINADHQLSPQVFDGIKVWWLRRPFQNVDLCLIQPFSWLGLLSCLKLETSISVQVQAYEPLSIRFPRVSCYLLFS